MINRTASSSFLHLGWLDCIILLCKTTNIATVQLSIILIIKLSLSYINTFLKLIEIHVAICILWTSVKISIILHVKKILYTTTLTTEYIEFSRLKIHPPLPSMFDWYRYLSETYLTGLVWIFNNLKILFLKTPLSLTSTYINIHL